MSGNDSIVNPWINIIACTTPEWISGNFPRYMIGGGFTSRCVFVFTDAKRQEIAYPDECVPPDHEETKQKLIHDLECISMLIGEYAIDPEARDWGRIWYREHWRNPPKDLQTDELGGYLARKQTHMHKLAMVLAAARGDDLVIRLEHLEYASRIITALESDMPKVFARIGQNDLTRAASDIVSIVERVGVISLNNLYSLLFKNTDFKSFELALNSAVFARQVSRQQEGNEIMIRRVKKDG